jgi:hypothetical protein
MRSVYINLTRTAGQPAQSRKPHLERAMPQAPRTHTLITNARTSWPPSRRLGAAINAQSGKIPWWSLSLSTTA